MIYLFCIVDTIIDVFPSPCFYLSTQTLPLTMVFTVLLSVSVGYVYMQVNLGFFGYQLPPPCAPLRSVSLFHVFRPLVLFHSSAYFNYQIPHMSKIIWYLFFSDWLISLSIRIFRSIHAVARVRFPSF